MYSMNLSLAIVSLINAHNIHYHASIQLVRILTEVAIKKGLTLTQSHTPSCCIVYTVSVLRWHYKQQMVTCSRSAETLRGAYLVA